MSQEVTRLPFRDITSGTEVIKYGNTIAKATSDISQGQWVHTHNARTNLSENDEYTYDHKVFPLPKVSDKSFMGFKRTDGSVGIRNEIWIIPTVGCVNSIATQLVKKTSILFQEPSMDFIPLHILLAAASWAATTNRQKNSLHHW